MVRDAGAPPGGVRVRASLPLPPERSRTAIAISSALHLLLVLALIRVTAAVVQPTTSPIGEAFKIAIGGGGGGGTGGTSFATTPPPPAVAALPPPPPVTIPSVVDHSLTPVVETPMVFRDTTFPPSNAAAPGTGGGSGGGAGTGAGPGTGGGVGPGSGGGTGGGSGAGDRAGTQAVNRQMIIPPLDHPKSLRGKSIEVTFFIDANGKVTDLLVNPPIVDRGFAKKFDETMRGYDWRPARDSLGKPVPGSVVYIISF